MAGKKNRAKTVTGDGKEDCADYKIIKNPFEIEVLAASFSSHHFSTHLHDAYTFGFIVDGAGGFRYLKEKCYAPSGCLTALNPFEPHDGFVCENSHWTYRTLYLHPEAMKKLLEDLSHHNSSLPSFQTNPILFDPDIYYLFKRFYRGWDNSADEAAVESQLLEILAMLIHRYSDSSLRLHPIGKEPRLIQALFEYLQDNYNQKITLSALSSLTGRDKFNVVRTFRRHTGMSPHEYLNQVRLLHVKRNLRNQKPIIDVALESGYYDQSHLNKSFKGSFGITPGQYSKSFNILQDNRI